MSSPFGEEDYLTASEILRRNKEQKKIIDDMMTPSPELYEKMKEFLAKMEPIEVYSTPFIKEDFYAMADQHNDPSRHPSNNPDFDAKRQHTIWYLSHPLAGDEKYTFEQNMAHVIHVMRICYEEGVIVIAPYHTICLALDDDNPEWRRLGLECDCNVAQKLGYLLMTGHKISSGMGHEAEAALRCPTGGIVQNLVGFPDEGLHIMLRTIRNGGRTIPEEV